ncbi:MAG: hypothetical protein NVSMB27_16930 [Ktedonobacteraceae bacterium]
MSTGTTPPISNAAFLPARSDEEKRLRALLEKTRDAVVLFDRQMNILYISSSIEQILGYAPAEYAQRANRFDLLHPDDQQQSRESIIALLQTPGESVTRQHRIRHKDGTYRWVEATITNLLDDPEVEAVLANFRDITDQKRAEEERQQLLQRERQARHEAELEQLHLRSLFAQAPALIHILRGPEHVFEFFHPLGKELVGGRDLSGMKVREALPEYEGQGYFELLDHVYQTGEPFSAKEMPSLLKAADGTLIERFFNAIYQPWYDGDGKIAGVLNFAVEVTDQVRARQQVEALAEALQRNQERLEHTNSELRRQRDELTALNTALEQANRARSQFISTMSHELRTPLTSILGFSQMLLKGAESTQLSQRHRDELGRILKNGKHLLALVNDVLDIAKIESGRIEVTASQVDVGTLLRSILEEVQPMALQQGIQLRSHVEVEAESLETDPGKLRQILLNLVSNAIKFTEQGEVSITATNVIGSPAAAEGIAIAVKDTGIGIPIEFHTRLFEPFYQVDGGYSRRFGGTGLGLAIVRQLTTVLGGTIAVASRPGEGSTFTVTLPCKVEARQVAPLQHDLIVRAAKLPRLLPPLDEPANKAPDTPDAGAVQSNTILAVDDNADIIHLLTTLLENTPYKVVGVQDPFQVLPMAQMLQPCAITLDVMMPQLNGWQLLYQLKTSPATAHIPVVMLTILAEQATGYVLGADEYLIKPFERETLLATLHRVVGQKLPGRDQ